jgi:hypothetical protein
VRQRPGAGGREGGGAGVSAAAAALLVLAAALAALALYRAAAPPPLRYPEATAALFERLDPNNDGYIDGAEYRQLAHPAQPLSAFDADGDGALAPWEVELLYLSVDPVWLFEAPR